MRRLSAIELATNERGVAVIELALLAPVLALLAIGTVDLSNAFSMKLALEQGAQRAVEKIMQTTQETTVESTLAAEAVCQVNGETTVSGVTTCNTSPITANNVTVTWRLLCTDSSGTTTSQTTTDSTAFDAMSCTAGSTSARYVELRVTETYTPLFPVHFGGYSSTDGGYDVSATAGMRTS